MLNNIKNTSFKKPYKFVSKSTDLDGGGIKKALLVGESVRVSSKDVKLDGYVQLPSRAGVNQLNSLIIKDIPKIYVSINEQILAQRSKGIRFALAVDAYINWGVNSKGKVILIGGEESEDEVNLDIFIFDSGRFVDYENRRLPSRSTEHFLDTVASLVDDYTANKPGYSIYQAAPLKPFGPSFSNISILDESIFRKISFKPISLKGEEDKNKAYIPALLVAVGFTFFVFALAKGWTEYKKAGEGYAVAIEDPVVKKQGGVDSKLIDVIQQRRFFMDEPRRQLSLTEKSKDLVIGIGRIQNLKIMEMKLPAPITAESNVQAKDGLSDEDREKQDALKKKPDVWFKISVPLANETAMSQGKGIMEQISINTGMDVRLARQGWAEDGKRRTFTLEGFIHE